MFHGRKRRRCGDSRLSHATRSAACLSPPGVSRGPGRPVLGSFSGGRGVLPCSVLPVRWRCAACGGRTGTPCTRSRVAGSATCCRPSGRPAGTPSSAADRQVRQRAIRPARCAITRTVPAGTSAHAAIKKTSLRSARIRDFAFCGRISATARHRARRSRARNAAQIFRVSPGEFNFVSRNAVD